MHHGCGQIRGVCSSIFRKQWISWEETLQVNTISGAYNSCSIQRKVNDDYQK